MICVEDYVSDFGVFIFYEIGEVDNFFGYEVEIDIVDEWRMTQSA